jgi:hypothetical protein
LAKYWTEKFSFVTGAVRYKDLAYLAMVKDEFAAENIEHTFPIEWDREEWHNFDLKEVINWNVVGISVCKYPIEQGIFLGLWGEILCVGSGDVHLEKIDCGVDASPKGRGPMRGIRSIGGRAYAVGMNQQVYRRDGNNLWTCIDQNTHKKSEISIHFEAIDGFSEKDIYVVGRKGEISQYNGVLWTQIDSPTNMVLTNICCAGNENIYACGRVGTVIRCCKDTWEVVEHNITQEDFWGIAWYNDKLYLSTMRFVYTLEENTLQRVNFDDITSTCFHLSVANDVLWSIGAKDVMAFDGKQWTRID